MLKIQAIKQEAEQAREALMDRLGVFYAFSPEQFDEQKVEGVEYGNLGYGGLCPISNSKEWVRESKKLWDEHVAKMRTEVPMDDYILYELRNHECFLTGDWDEAMVALGYYPECTEDDCRRVYNANFAEYADQ